MNLTNLQAPTVESPGLVSTPSFDSSAAWSGIADGISDGLRAKAIRDKAQREIDNDASIGRAVVGGLEDANALLFDNAQTQQAREMEANLESQGVVLDEAGRQSIREAQGLARTEDWLRETGQHNTLAQLKLNTRKIDFISKRPELAGDYLTVLDRATSQSTSLLSKNEDTEDARRAKAAADRDEYMTKAVQEMNLWTPGMSKGDISRSFQEGVRPYAFNQKMAEDELKGLQNNRAKSEIVATEQLGPNFLVNFATSTRAAMQGKMPTERPAIVRQAFEQAMMYVQNNMANAPEAQAKTIAQLQTLVTNLDKEAIGGPEADAARNMVTLMTDMRRVELRTSSKTYTTVAALVEDSGPSGVNSWLTEANTAGLVNQAGREVMAGSGLGQTVVEATAKKAQYDNGEGVEPPSASIPKGSTPEYRSTMLDKKMTSSVQASLIAAAQLQSGKMNRSSADAAALDITTYLADPGIKNDGKMMGKLTEYLSDDRFIPLFQGSQFSPAAASQVTGYTRSMVDSLGSKLEQQYGKPANELVTVNVDSGMVTVEAVPGSPITQQQEFKLSQSFTHLLRAYAHVKGTDDYDTAGQELFQ